MPMNSNPFAAAPRYGAKTRNGTPCQAPAVIGSDRCRMHGGSRSGAPSGNRNAFKDGFYGANAMAHRRDMNAFIREMTRQAEQFEALTHPRG